MKRIYKYIVNLGSPTVVKTGRFYKFLEFERQGDALCLWVLVDPEQPQTTRHIVQVFGTGHPIPPEYENYYLGTCQDPPFVWHAFRSDK